MVPESITPTILIEKRGREVNVHQVVYHNSGYTTCYAPCLCQLGNGNTSGYIFVKFLCPFLCRVTNGLCEFKVGCQFILYTRKVKLIVVKIYN